jgi:hypothetical protein
MYRIDIHSIETGERVDHATASSGSTHNQRSDIAERMIRTYYAGCVEDYYVVEYEIQEDGSAVLLNKYRV